MFGEMAVTGKFSNGGFVDNAKLTVFFQELSVEYFYSSEHISDRFLLN